MRNLNLGFCGIVLFLFFACLHLHSQPTVIEDKIIRIGGPARDIVYPGEIDLLKEFSIEEEKRLISEFEEGQEDFQLRAVENFYRRKAYYNYKKNFYHLALSLSEKGDMRGLSKLFLASLEIGDLDEQGRLLGEVYRIVAKQRGIKLGIEEAYKEMLMKRFQGFQINVEQSEDVKSQIKSEIFYILAKEAGEQREGKICSRSSIPSMLEIDFLERSTPHADSINELQSYYYDLSMHEDSRFLKSMLFEVEDPNSSRWFDLGLSYADDLEKTVWTTDANDLRIELSQKDSNPTIRRAHVYFNATCDLYGKNSDIAKKWSAKAFEIADSMENLTDWDLYFLKLIDPSKVGPYYVRQLYLGDHRVISRIFDSFDYEFTARNIKLAEEFFEKTEDRKDLKRVRGELVWDLSGAYAGLYRYGMAKNMALAAKYAQKTLEFDVPDSTRKNAQVRLFVIYTEGWGVEKNKALADKYFADLKSRKHYDPANVEIDIWKEYERMIDDSEKTEIWKEKAKAIRKENGAEELKGVWFDPLRD